MQMPVSNVTHKVNAAWRKWRMPSGVLCDQKMLIKLKSKVYQNGLRSAMIYVAEFWAVKKQHKQENDPKQNKNATMGSGAHKT